MVLERERAAAGRRLRVGAVEMDEATLRAVLQAWAAGEEEQESEGDIESPTKRRLLSAASFRSAPSRKPLRAVPEGEAGLAVLT